MSEFTTIIISKKIRAKLDKYQKSKKLRTRNDAVEELLNNIISR